MGSPRRLGRGGRQQVGKFTLPQRHDRGEGKSTAPARPAGASLTCNAAARGRRVLGRRRPGPYHGRAKALEAARPLWPGGAVELPLFPLSTVLYPGLPIPLHVFEDRYREMFGRVLDGERRFGVVAIVHGHEVGGSAVYHPIGCVAEVRDVRRHPDGRLDVVARGEQRFRIEGVTHGERAAERIVPVGRLFNRYVTDLLEMAGEDEIEQVDLPDDPVVASYLVAAGLQIDLPDKQNLLAVPSASERLRAEVALLRRELSLLERLGIAGPARLTVSFSLN